jgi:hypothetical protein
VKPTDATRKHAPASPIIEKGNAREGGVPKNKVEEYKRQLAELLGHKPSAVAQAGTGQQVDANMRSQIRVWRMRAEELRTTAEQFEVPSAQDSLRSAARNYDLMADNLEALLSIQPSVNDAKAS